MVVLCSEEASGPWSRTGQDELLKLQDLVSSAVYAKCQTFISAPMPAYGALYELCKSKFMPEFLVQKSASEPSCGDCGLSVKRPVGCLELSAIICQNGF